MKAVKIIFNTIFYLILSLILFLVGYFFVCKIILKQPLPMLFGYGNAVVISNSMDPTLKVNDMVFIHKQDSYQKGDIITFVDSSNMIVTHRIVRVENGNYFTKGDNKANSEDLESKTTKQIFGKVVGVWAGFGAVLAFFQSPAGLVTMLSVIGLIVMLVILFSKKKEEVTDTPAEALQEKTLSKKESKKSQKKDTKNKEKGR